MPYFGECRNCNGNGGFYWNQKFITCSWCRGEKECEQPTELEEKQEEVIQKQTQTIEELEKRIVELQEELDNMTSDKDELESEVATLRSENEELRDRLGYGILDDIRASVP